MMLAHAMSRRFVRAVARRIAARDCRVSVTGAEHVPADGPALLAVRHVHHLYDGAVLLSVLSRDLQIMVALDWARSRLQRRYMETATRLARWPVVLRGDALAIGSDGNPRNTGGAYRRAEAERYHLRAMKDGLTLLSDGRALAIFPEAYPSIDPGYSPKSGLDDMLDFRHGFAVLARLARDRRGLRVPIVPVGLRYARGARWEIALAFGAPVTLEADEHPAVLVRDVERRVRALSGLGRIPDAGADLRAAPRSETCATHLGM